LQHKVYVISVVVLFVIFASRENAGACSCTGSSTACGSYAGATAVFIGYVKDVNSQHIKNEEGNEYLTGQSATVQVEKTFKGSPGAQVLFRSYGTSCDPVYKEGQRWLFYGYYSKEKKAWEIAACDRSTLIENANEDLLYLQKLPDAVAKTRIAGRVDHYEEDPEKGFSRVKNIIGAKITITGTEKTYEVYTDKNGVYEIYGLPPGLYDISSEIPVGLKLRFPIVHGQTTAVGQSPLDKLQSKMTSNLKLADKGCLSVDFILSANNSIAGKVFSADERPLANVCLDLIPLDTSEEKLKERHFRVFNCTKDTGSFLLDGMPPGRYIIAANSEGKLINDEPFPTIYYPGTLDREKATVIEMTQGDVRTDYDIHVPPPAPKRTLSGLLLYSDGNPVADGSVKFEADEVKEGTEVETHTTTDAQGRFALTVVQGLKGSLTGSIISYQGERPNCPQLDAIIQKNGDSTPVTTDSLKLEVNSDVGNIELKFPFPYCAKKEP